MIIPASRGVEQWTLGVYERTGEYVADLVMQEGSAEDEWDGSRDVPHRVQCVLLEEPPRLRGRLLQGRYHCLGAEHLLGTWVPQPVIARHSATGTVWELPGLDPTSRLAGIRLARRWSFPAGTSVGPAVRQAVADHAPDVVVLIDGASETLREPRSFEAGTTSLLEMVNLLLESAGLTWLRPDAHGRLLSRPVAVTSAVPAVTWSDVGGAKFLPDDLTTPGEDPLLPNEVVAIAPGGETHEGLVGYWSDPVAIAAYGRVTEHIEISATSQAAAHAQARERGTRPRRAASETTWQGPWQPIRGGSYARLDWTDRGLHRVAELVLKSAQWAPGMPTSYTIQGAAT